MKTIKNLMIALLMGMTVVAFANNNPSAVVEPMMTIEKEAASQKMIIRLGNLQNRPTELIIKNIDGTVVYNENFNNQSTYAKVLDLQGLVSGTYIVEVAFADIKVKQTITLNNEEVVVDAASLKTVAKPSFKTKQNKVSVLGAISGDVKVTIFDASLNMVYRADENATGTFAKRYDLSRLSKGDYLVKVVVNGEEFLEYVTVR